MFEGFSAQMRMPGAAMRATTNTLRKVSEIYDRIGFGGVGKYNEFDQLRIAGVRHADLKGFNFSREDVDARSLANQYAQILGQIFTHEMKPMEVEILVAEVGHGTSSDQLFHILYDGTVMDETDFSVLGGDADTIAQRLRDSWRPEVTLAEALGIAATALAGPERTLGADDLEVALLSRDHERRSFRRLDDAEVTSLLASLPPAVTAPQDAETGAAVTAADTPGDDPDT